MSSDDLPADGGAPRGPQVVPQGGAGAEPDPLGDALSRALGGG